MKKIKKELIRTILLLGIGYGILKVIGFVMNLSIPVPVLIVIFCCTFYYTLKNVIERRI